MRSADIICRPVDTCVMIGSRGRWVVETKTPIAASITFAASLEPLAAPEAGLGTCPPQSTGSLLYHGTIPGHKSGKYQGLCARTLWRKCSQIADAWQGRVPLVFPGF